MNPPSSQITSGYNDIKGHTIAIDLKTENRFSLLIPGPFDFHLTVAKPAGWHWSTLNEIFGDSIFWSGIYFKKSPIGLKMSATGNKVNVVAFSNSLLADMDVSELKSNIRSGLGASEDLPAFYQFAREDPILSVTVED
jgi:hypothetical protein